MNSEQKPGWLVRTLGAPMTIGNALILLVIIAAIVVFVVLVVGGAFKTQSAEGSPGLTSSEYARYLITVIFAGGTMLIAIMLCLFLITTESKEAKERFTQGKEILTILIGVFGTILGFYYGKADTDASLIAPSGQSGAVGELDPADDTPPAPNE